MLKKQQILVDGENNQSAFDFQPISVRLSTNRRSIFNQSAFDF